jgi:gamma-glutamylcyclotransferase (GGCT)/AIG2-like uncharacterized protein YtfP
MPKLFVYGTLKEGFPNHPFLKGARRLDDAIMDETILLHLGGYPGMISGDGAVYGELYEITEDMLPALDRLEGHPMLFKRIETFCCIWDIPRPETVKCLAYFFQPMMDLKNYFIIKNGRWELESPEWTEEMQ